MKILIVSDVHNQWNNLARAIERGTREGCNALLFAGDAHEPHVFAELCAFQGEIHAVWGNNDVPHLYFQPALLLHPRVQHHGESMEIELGNTHVFMSHYPEDAEAYAETHERGIAIHGHTHKQRDEVVHGVRIINPGECCGTRYGTASCAVFDTVTSQCAFHTL